jgi:RND family efflux transporter MFP subunit
VKNLLAALSLVAGLVACGRPAAETAAPAAEVVRAPLARVERGAAPAELELTGTVEAERATAVTSRVVALVTAVHVDLGDAVRRGDLLVSIDPTAAEGELAQARGALAQARAALALAERNHERYRALAASDAASELELDLARMQHEQARGAVEQAEGAVAAARSVAGESRVVAPYDGRVAARSVEVGDLAAPGRPLVLLQSDAGRRLAVAVPERLARASALAPGGRLEVALDARPELGRFEAEVIEVSPGPDPATHAFTVRLGLGELDVAAGAAGRAYLVTGSREVVTVPAAALVESGGLDLVVVRDADGRARSRVVTVGSRRADGAVEILSGLDGGESVALGLAAAPRAGATIEPELEGPAS